MKKVPSYRKKIVKTTKGKIAYGVVRIQGKDHYLGEWNTKSSKQEYERLIGEYLASGRVVDKLGVATVLEIVIDYTEHMKARYTRSDGKPSNEYRIIKRVMKVFRTRYGSKLASEFRPSQFKAIRDHFVGEADYLVHFY